MATPESRYMAQLSEADQARMRELVSTCRNLGLAGCADCKLPEWIAGVKKDQDGSLIKSNAVSDLQHYAIELNGAKRPLEHGASFETQRVEEFEEAVLRSKLAELEIPDDHVEAFADDFLTCIKCTAALRYIGDFPSFSEAVVLLQTERQMPLPPYTGQ